MTAAEVVKDYLLTLSPVTALIVGRVFTLRFPQSPTLPAVLVQQISDVQSPHLRGTDGLRWGRVQIDCLGATIASARAVDQAVMGAYTAGVATGLRGAVASVGGSPAVDIKQALSVGYREFYDADELKQARTSRDYLVWTQGLDA